MTLPFRLAASTALALTLMASAAAATPRVVASIKPVHSITAAIMKGAGEPELLLDAAVSEHTAQLKPSQVEALQNADLIVVVGDNLEAFFRLPPSLVCKVRGALECDETIDQHHFLMRHVPSRTGIRVVQLNLQARRIVLEFL